ncbi:hypothetical protein [Dolichospermum phage Dfl-JY45]
MKPRTARAIEGDAARAVREAAVREAALATGVSIAYKERAAEIRERLQAMAPELDRIYNFNVLLDQGRLLVPAVELVREVSAIEADGTQLRETGRVLRIVEAAKLVTAAPTWRDYLSAWGASSTVAAERPSDDLLPTNAAEREVWRAALEEAWSVGRRQADAVFRGELAVLSEAYLGRVRYRMLVDQKIIQPAAIGQTDFGIVTEDEVVRIEDALFTVRQAAAFASPREWRAMPRAAVPSSPRVRVLQEEVLQ